MMNRASMLFWSTIISGAALFLAPFVFSYTGTPAAAWTCLVMGVAMAVLGYLNAYKWAAAAGAVTFVAPWILGFSGVGAALWSCLILGALVAILNWYYGFSAKEEPASVQHRSA